MTRKEELIDELLKECNSPEDILGEGGLLKQLTKSLVERALEGEMTDHLGYPKHSPIGKNTSNSRNGKTSKTIKGKNGKMEIAVPRDRNGEFEPQLIPKYHRRFDGFSDNPDSRVVKNSMGSILYYFLLLSKHPLAKKFYKEAMKYSSNQTDLFN